MIELYQAEWCPHSRKVRERLTELRIDFVARQVEPEPEDRDALRAATGTVEIPVLVADGERICGGDDAIAWMEVWVMVKTGSDMDLIVRNPRVQGGEPVVQGTRVPVRSIVIASEEYAGDLARVAHAFSIDIGAVRVALAYYGQHQTEIDQIIERHERASLS